MKLRIGLAILGGTILLAACGGTSGSTAAGGREIAEVCKSELNASDEICACIGEAAARDLSRDQIDFLLASVQEDQAAIVRLRQELGIAGATEAGMFLINAPADCARDLSAED